MARPSFPTARRSSNQAMRSSRSRAPRTSRAYAVSSSAITRQPRRVRLAHAAEGGDAVALPLGHELRPAREVFAFQVLVKEVVARRARLSGLAAQQHARLIR